MKQRASKLFEVFGEGSSYQSCLLYGLSRGAISLQGVARGRDSFRGHDDLPKARGGEVNVMTKSKQTTFTLNEPREAL
jgi:hypothetical protein